LLTDQELDANIENLFISRYELDYIRRETKKGSKLYVQNSIYSSQGSIIA
jgi:hypothetical protein